MRHKKTKANYRRILLRLPDLDHTKTAVLNSLTSPASRRVYQYAIDKFIACTVRNRGSHSIESLWSATEFIWNPARWRLIPSTSTSRP